MTPEEQQPQISVESAIPTKESEKAVEDREKNAKLRIDNDGLRERNQLWKQGKNDELARAWDEHAVRMGLINKLLVLTIIWMVFIFLIILAVGKKQLEFSTPVMIAIITTLSTEVLGFFYVVVKYIYNEKSIPNKDIPSPK